MAAWVMRVASSCFDSLVRCNVLELCLFPPMNCEVRGMTSSFPMDEPLRSGIRPEPQHWNSDESTDVEETSAEEDQDWNNDSDPDWTIDSEGRSSLSGGSVCALVASDGQASLRRSISEADLLVSEEEVNQTFACRKEDLVGITGLCKLLTNPLAQGLAVTRAQSRYWRRPLVRARAASYPNVGQGVRAHDVRQSPLALPPHVWTSATLDASFCTGRAEASHLEVLASVEMQIRSNWAQQAHDTRPAEEHLCGGGTSALPRGTHHTS